MAREFEALASQIEKRAQRRADVEGARAAGRAGRRFGGQATDIGLAGQTQARAAALDPAALQIAQIGLEGARTGEQRRFQTSEREAGQRFGTSERLGRQEFGTAERVGGQQFRTGERVGGQEFTAGERVLGRQFETGERIGGQEFTAGERELGRQFQTGERRAGEIAGGIRDEQGNLISFGEFGTGRAALGKETRQQQAAIDEHLFRVQNPSSGKSRFFDPFVEGALGGLGNVAGQFVGGRFLPSKKKSGTAGVAGQLTAGS